MDSLDDGEVTLAAYLAFLGAAGVLAITPGPDTVLSLRYALHSRRAGLRAATGSSLALLVWAGLAAAGVVAILRASETAYRSLTLLGGLYLLFLGARTAVSLSRARRLDAAPSTDARAGRVRVSDPFWAGVMTCLTNPKTGLFFLALFPLFTPPEADAWFVFVALGGTVAVVIYGYLIAVVLLADAASRWLQRPRVSRSIEAVTALVLAALGVHMLVTALRGLEG